MKTEVRTKITEFAAHVEAAFDMIDAVMANPEMDAELNGTTVRALERVETSERGKPVSREIAFEVVHPNKQGTTLPEMERVLVPA
jgi:hypothetical protein